MMPKNAYNGKIMKKINIIKNQEVWEKIRETINIIIKTAIINLIKMEEKGNP